MQLRFNQTSNPFLFINNAIMDKMEKQKRFELSHEDRDEYNNGGIYHTDVTHEDRNEDTWAGHVNIDKEYHNDYWKKDPLW